MENEYPEEGRFAWDMIELTEAEMDQLVSYADAGLIDEADEVVNQAEQRMYGAVQ